LTEELIIRNSLLDTQDYRLQLFLRLQQPTVDKQCSILKVLEGSQEVSEKVTDICQKR